MEGLTAAILICGLFSAFLIISVVYPIWIETRIFCYDCYGYPRAGDPIHAIGGGIIGLFKPFTGFG